jgi:uncharacterized protein
MTMAVSLDDGDFYGRGLRFPPGIGPDGRVAFSSGADNVRDSIRVILSTELRERVMLPEFGGGLKRYLFRPNVASMHRLIQETITQALGRWEARIQIESVEVGSDPRDARAARAVVRYKVVATGRREQVQVQVQLA